MSCTLLTSDLLLSAAAQCIPPIGMGGGLHHHHLLHQQQLQASHSSGSVCIVGGSASQPGALYLAALAALRAGADRVQVICADAAAAAAVRGYGPEMTVVRDASAAAGNEAQLVSLLSTWLSECQAVLVGPGLESSVVASGFAAMTIKTAVSLNQPLVIDGAALAVVVDNPDLVRGVQRAILTPNWPEFCALFEATIPAGTATSNFATSGPDAEASKRLASRLSVALGGVCVLLKGREDAVAAGPDGQVESCALQGCGRRCSGQGAILSGLALVFANWCFAAADARAASNATATTAPALATLPPLLRHPALLAAYAAAALARRCAAQAFAAHRRATLAGNMADQIGPAFCRLFPEADGMR